MASVKVLEKAGFEREGTKRQNLPIHEQWIDNHLYALLDAEYAGNNSHEGFPSETFRSAKQK